MNYLLLVEGDFPGTKALETIAPGDSLKILLAIRKDKLASEIDSHIKKILQQAQELQSQLLQQNIQSEILMEFSATDESISAHVEREKAILLK
ncbi:MAG: hypothetical protein AABX01_06525 [Candidatus Micrarchaeota archaeon]